MNSIQLTSVLVQGFGKAYLENVVLENITNTDNVIIYSALNSENVTVSNITIRNVTGASTGIVNEVLLFNDFLQTLTVINQLHASDIELNRRTLISSNLETNQIEIYNSVIESVNITSSDYIINTGLVKSVILYSCTISNIRTTDDTNTNGAVLFVNTLDLNDALDTNIQDIIIDD